MAMYDTSLDDEPQDYFNNATLRISDVRKQKNALSADKNSTANQSDNSSLFSLDIALADEAKAGAKSPSSSSSNARPKDAVMPWSGDDASTFFASREGFVKRAIDECSKELVNDKIGKLLGAWLLTEISLWDNEKERLVLLTTDELIIVKYDFIALKMLDSKRVPLNIIDTVINGDLVYPSGSIVPPRNSTGVRAMWNNGQPLDFLTKWNAFSSDVPWFTVTSHPLLRCKETTTEEKKLYCVDNFYAEFVKALELVTALTPCNIQHKPILLENYIGLTSLIHNKCSLGFFKIRGKFSF
nr:PREDICTED: tumor protein p63-regulated gene 1-like protein isoform X2 [Bemisia tabaci]